MSCVPCEIVFFPDKKNLHQYYLLLVVKLQRCSVKIFRCHGLPLKQWEK